MVSMREGGLLVREVLPTRTTKEERRIEKKNRSWTFWSSREKIREMDFGVGLCLSLDVWTRGFDKGDLRELPNSFLKRKESKVSGENSNLCLPVGIERLLGCLSWEKSRKKWGGAWWLHCWPSLGLWGLSTCKTLWHYICWISIGCMWVKFLLYYLMHHA